MPNGISQLSQIADALNRHGVDYVIIGGIAVILHGGETVTQDVDLAFDCSESNLERLADALEELSAKPKRWKVLNYRLSAADMSSRWLHLDSKFGNIDLIAETPGISYASLKQDAQDFIVGAARCPVASIQMLIQIKRVAGRGKDSVHLADLERLLKFERGDHGAET